MVSKKLKKYIVIILVASLVSLLLFYFLIDNKFYTVVEGRIYRSARLSGDDLEKYIREKNIKTILNLAGRRDEKEWYKKEKEIAQKYNIQLHDLGISPNELPEIDRIFSIVNVLVHAEKPILIHCRKGIDRTGFVSALALSIEKDPPLSEIKKQFSFRFGIIPVYRSVGPYFFEQYEKWLKETGRTHSNDVLLYWITNEYVDYKGNIMYWIDSINDKIFNDKKIHIENNPEELILKGWSFEFKTNNPPVGIINIRPDNRISSRAVIKNNRPGVARYFNLGEKYYETFVVGWEATLRKEDFSPGCHDIYIQYVKDESLAWNFDTDFEFCLN
jgi:protein tyrosine/serine phosphatase